MANELISNIFNNPNIPPTNLLNINNTNFPVISSNISENNNNNSNNNSTTTNNNLGIVNSNIMNNALLTSLG